MKGQNTLKLNQATMIEALQYWLDSQLVKAGSQVVKEVREEDNISSTFKVLIEEKEQP